MATPGKPKVKPYRWHVKRRDGSKEKRGAAATLEAAQEAADRAYRELKAGPDGAATVTATEKGGKRRLWCCTPAGWVDALDTISAG